ncbi:hypothetical protein [Helicobacter sp. 23-1045]
MISRIFSTLAFGAIFGLFPLIMFYGGVWINYFAPYEIKEYFNGFFTQNLNLYFYALFGAFSGICFVANGNFLKILYLLCAMILMATLIPSVGQSVGQKLFLKENVRIIQNGKSEVVRVIYKDKYKFYYNTAENPKVVKVNLSANRAENRANPNANR